MELVGLNIWFPFGDLVSTRWYKPQYSKARQVAALSAQGSSANQPSEFEPNASARSFDVPVSMDLLSMFTFNTNFMYVVVGKFSAETSNLVLV